WGARAAIARHAQSGHVWMAPGEQGVFSRSGFDGHLRSCVRPVVAAPGRGLLMGSVDRGLIMAAGSRCPNDDYRSVSIRRLTDDPIRPLPPRKLLFSPVFASPARPRQGAEVPLAPHDPPPDAPHLVAQRTRDQLARLAREQLDEPGVLLGALAAQHRH